LWGLPGWMGGKLLAGIIRGNRTTNQAGIDAFRERARTTLNTAAPPAPAAPPPTTAVEPSSPPPTRNEPKRGRAKKAKKRSAWQNFLDGYEKLAPWINSAPIGGMPGRSPGRMSPTARMSGGPSRPSMQRGSFSTAEVLQPKPAARPRRTAAPGGRSYTSSRRKGVRATGPGARAAPRVSSATQLNDDLSPVEVPQRERYTDLQPIEVPERERYTGLDPVEVPNRRKYGNSPGAQPGSGTNSPGRKPGVARNPSPVALPGVGTVARTRPSAASIRIGQFEIPIEPIIRAVTTRKPPQRARQASDPRPGISPEPVLTPGSNPFEQVSYAYDYDKKCRCPKKKASKPRQPRTECRSGTYKQTARGVTYRPSKIIPCT